jgi:hypothetical protein
VERCAALGMRYEETWARLLLARAALAAGGREGAEREARAALASAERSDLRGIRWRAAAWLADAFGGTDPALWPAAADALERFLEEFAPGERDLYVEGAGIDAALARWSAAARATGATAGAARLGEARDRIHAAR